jgi:hypothetical protein
MPGEDVSLELHIWTFSTRNWLSRAARHARASSGSLRSAELATTFSNCSTPLPSDRDNNPELGKPVQQLRESASQVRPYVDHKGNDFLNITT